MRSVVDFHVFHVHLRPGCCDGSPPWAGGLSFLVRGQGGTSINLGWWWHRRTTCMHQTRSRMERSVVWVVQRGEDHWEGLVQRKEQHLWRSRGSDVWAQDFLPTFTSLLWLISYWATERALFLHAWGALAVRQQCVVSSGHGLSAETCLDAIAAGDPMEDRCRQLAWHVDLAGCKLIELGMFDSSTALWEVMKQHLWVWEISFKWQWTKSFKLLSQAGLAWRARRSSCPSLWTPARSPGKASLWTSCRLWRAGRAADCKQRQGSCPLLCTMPWVHNAEMKSLAKSGSTLGWASLSQVQWRPIPQKLRPRCAKLLAECLWFIASYDSLSWVVAPKSSKPLVSVCGWAGCAGLACCLELLSAARDRGIRCRAVGRWAGRPACHVGQEASFAMFFLGTCCSSRADSLWRGSACKAVAAAVTELAEAAPNACAFRVKCRMLPCSVVHPQEFWRSRIGQQEALFGEAKETNMAARSMIPCAKCAGLAMFEVAVDLPQVASYQVWVVTFVLLPFHWPCSTSVLTICERSRRYLQCICRTEKLGTKLNRFQILHVPPAHLHASNAVLIDMAFIFFNPTWPSALQKVWNWRVGIAPTHARCISSIWACLLLESLKEIERADAFPVSCKCMSSSSL